VDKRNFFFGETVTEATLDQSFDWAEDADQALASDTGMVGIHLGLVVSEQAVPDLTVQITGGAATGPSGERIYVSAPTTTVSCAVDRYGQATDVGVPGEERWCALYARFTRNATDPAVDDNGVTVYTKQYEAVEFLLEQGTAAVIPTATRPALLADAVHLCDFKLVNAQTAVTNGDLDLTRRQDWLRLVLSNLSTTVVYGTPQAACEALWTAMDALADSTGGALVGVADYTTANAHVTWAGATSQDALEATADAIDGHIVGAAPNHPASAISTAAIAGTPESEAAPSTTQAVLANVFTHLNARTERATNERVTASWDVFGDAGGATSDSIGRVRGEVITGSIAGGSWPRDTTLANIASRMSRAPWIKNLCSPTLAANTINLGGVPIASHAMVVRDSLLYTGRQRRIIAVVAQTVGSAGAGTAGACYLVDPHDPATLVANPTLGGLPTGGGRTWAAMSACSSGAVLFVQYYDPITTGWRVQAYDATSDLLPVASGWPATGIDPTPGFTGAPGAGSTRMRTNRIVMASSTKVATLNGHVVLSAAGRPALSIFNAADGGALAVGLGDVATGATVITSGGLCSDGTNLYFTTVANGTGVTTLNSAIIATLAGRASWTLHNLGTASGASENYCQDLCWTGESVVAPCEDGTLKATSTDNLYGLMTVWAATPIVNKLRWVAFDGLNVWAFGVADYGGNVGLSLDASLMHHPAMTGGSTLGLADVARVVSLMRLEEQDTLFLADPADIGAAVWDGDAIWSCLNDGQVASSPEMLGYIRAIRASSRR
jgi:hypothetical protein